MNKKIYDSRKRKTFPFYLNRYELTLIKQSILNRKYLLEGNKSNEENKEIINHLNSILEGLERLLKVKEKLIEIITIRIEQDN